VVSGAALAAVPGNGVYKGTTSQKQKIVLQVQDRAVTSLEIFLKCGTKMIHTGSFPLAVAKPTGSFAFTDKQVPEGTLIVSGTFTTPRIVTGKLTLKAPGCKPVTFSAKR
jgi:hypothetical protein